MTFFQRQTTMPSEFEKDVILGLSLAQKKISPKYFYDDEGSQLFNRITQIEDYYLTRTEVDLLRRYAPEISKLAKPESIVLEYGPGDGLKASLILQALVEPKAYLPIDISEELLLETKQKMSQLFPKLRVEPICSDFFHLNHHHELVPTDLARPSLPKFALFLGSTLGNMESLEARSFLSKILQGVQHDGSLLLGVDLLKEKKVLENAYNDSQGLTAQFNLNLLTRINRELHANFDLSQFKHRALFNSELNRIEMHIESLRDQVVSIRQRSFHFQKGETIHTENSYKYSIEQFLYLAQSAGWTPCRHWTDAKEYFGLFYLKAA